MISQDEQYALWLDSLCVNCESQPKVSDKLLCTTCFSQLFQQSDDEEEDYEEVEDSLFLPENATYEELIEFEERQNSTKKNSYFDALKEILPIRKAREEEKAETCAICLENYAEEEFACELPCEHKFHKHCAHSWLRKNSCCPLCKKDAADFLKF